MKPFCFILISCVLFTGCMTTMLALTQKEETGGYVADIKSAYLFEDKLFIQFTTKNDERNKWTQREFKEYKLPEHCECNYDNSCGKGEWQPVDHFKHGDIPEEYTKKGIPLKIEKRSSPDQEHKESSFWVIHLPSDGKDHPEDYSEAGFGGRVSKKTLKPAAVLLLPLAVAADIVLLPVYIIGTIFLPNPHIGR